MKKILIFSLFACSVAQLNAMDPSKLDDTEESSMQLDAAHYEESLLKKIRSLRKERNKLRREKKKLIDQNKKHVAKIKSLEEKEKTETRSIYYVEPYVSSNKSDKKCSHSNSCCYCHDQVLGGDTGYDPPPPPPR